MATRFIDKEYGATVSTAIANDATGTAKVKNLPDAAGFVYDIVDNTFKFNAAGTIKTLADTSTAQTLTNKTLTSPVINGASGAGAVVTLAGVLTENGAATSYTLTFPIPAGAILHNVRVIPQVLWNGTSASLKVGDTADDDGYFVGVDLKATDLLVGEVLSAEDGDLWGGKNGAYLVAATGRRGPTSSNFGQYYLAGSNITAIVTPGAADGSAGRTVVEVEYSIPTAVAQVTV